jgi:hypothetical protein
MYITCFLTRNLGGSSGLGLKHVHVIYMTIPTGLLPVVTLIIIVRS